MAPEQRTALGIIPEMVVLESAREKRGKKTAGEKLAGMQKQKEQFEQEPARPEKYTVRVYGHTPPLPTPPGLIPADTVKSRNNPVK